MTISCVLYKRVSTVHQLDGASLDAQDARLRAWCAANDGVVVGSYQDAGISGGKMTNRPGLLAALNHVTKCKGTLCAYSLSRIARSTRNAIEIADRLNKAGCALVSLTEQISSASAIGQFMFSLLAALGQLEKDLASERVTSTMSYLRTQSRRISRFAPFGTDLGHGKTLIPNPREQGIIETMKGWRVDGDSYAYIADRLNGMGQPTKQPGGRWTASTCKRILEREAKSHG